MMNEIKTLKYQQAVILENAIDIHIKTLDFRDARFKCKDGSYSSQLVFARSQSIPTKMTQPQAELYPVLINTHTGEVVRTALGHYHTNAFKCTDSQIVLHWISNENHLLKQWVHSKVIEIKCFTNPDQW